MRGDLQNCGMARHGFWRRGFLGLVAVCLLGAGWVAYRMRGPYLSYEIDVEVASGAGGVLEAGVAIRDITPDLGSYDGWVDADGNGRFELHRGDRLEDRNGNGRPDLVWLGGFDMNRPAKGVNDPLWVRALALRRGGVTVVMVTVDCVGLTHERIIQLRKSIDQERLGISHIMLSSTHTHNSPDTMGIWSERPFFSRFNEEYVQVLLRKSREAVLEAVEGLEPVVVKAAAVDLAPEGFVRDSRLPEVYDRQLCVMEFDRVEQGGALCTLVSWGNHPEAMGGGNPLLSSDFVHYWRQGVEMGVPGPGGVPGLGGVCLFFQGSVGGLMTPLRLAVPDKSGEETHLEDGVEKARALGENLALRTLEVLRGGEAVVMEDGRIGVVARTIYAPIEGTFKIPVMLGLVHPGWYGGKAKTEVNAIRVGDVEILTVPGELYPEIAEGGVESPEGADYFGEPVEVPGLRSRMSGKVNMLFNLANDEIGYLVPKTQWDRQPPYTYGQERAPYGEVNSGGPDVAGVVHKEAMAALERLHAMMGE